MAAEGEKQSQVHNAPTSENNSDVEAEGSNGKHLDRYLGLVTSVAFNAVLSSSWSAVAVSFQAGLFNGGPTALVWGTLLCIFGTIAIAASMAEMASINPVVGAQYRWTALYAPRGIMSPAFWSLLQGWITVFAWIALDTQVTFLMGTIVQGLIVQNNPTYIPARWHGTLLAWAVLLLPTLGSLFARRFLAPLEKIAGVLNVVFFFVLVIVLGAMAPSSSAKFVFTTTTTGHSGWSSPGVQWCIGLLSGAFPLASFDGVIHMSAEISDPRRRVPWAMVVAPLINGIFAFFFMIALLFTIGDLDAALNTPTRYPIIEVLYAATKSQAGTDIMMAMILYLGMMVLLSVLTSSSRLTWAFARDNGLPYSRFFAEVSSKYRIPLNSLLLNVAITVLLMLINIGSTTAFFAIVSLSTLSLYISYIIPVVFFTLYKLRGGVVNYGPFRLGRLGLPVNFFAIAYGIFIATFLSFPPELPVNAANMNWAGPAIGAVILFAVLDWCVSGRKRWKAPV